MWLNFILMGVGPYILLITLNTLMLLKLKEMARERESEHGIQAGRNNSRYHILAFIYRLKFLSSFYSLIEYLFTLHNYLSG
jgi:hypothetical protein